MTRRSPLWITALAVALGAAAWAPTGAGAQTEERDDLFWDVTIDTEDVVESRDVVVSGQAVGRVAGIGRPDSVVVTVEPLGLPPQCGDDGTVIEDVGEDGSYRTVFRTKCNGPYRLEVAAQVNGVPSSRPTVKQIGVGEPPQEAPPAPSPDGAFMRWAPPTDPDAHGWLLMVDEGEPQDLGLDVTSASVPADTFTHTFELVLVRWGAGGPGTDLLASPKSRPGASETPTPQKPGPGPGPGPEVPGPVDPPTGEQPPSGTEPPGSSSTAPPPTSGSTTPSRGTGAPSTTLPAGYTEELPYGVPDDAFEPGSDPASDGASGDEETAAGTSPARGLVSTSEERAPGLVAPFALGLLLITVAVHIAWFLRRSRPPGGGQVMPH